MKISITVELDDHSITRTVELGGDANPLYRSYVCESGIQYLGAQMAEEVASVYGDIRTTRTNMARPLGSKP